MSDAILWNCQLEDNQNLTVGSVFRLSCQGNLEAKLQEPLQLVLPKETPAHALVLLNAKEVTEKTLVAELTSYRAGKFDFPFVQFSDGETTIDAGKVSFEVQSVLQKDSKPIGPFGPFGLDFPQILIYAAIGAGAFVLLVLSLAFWRHRKKKALESALERYHSRKSPFLQFESTLRGLLQRARWKKQMDVEEIKEYIEDSEEALRVYFLRMLKIQTMDMSLRALRKEITKREPSSEKNWIRWIKEFRLMRAQPQKVDLPSLIEILDQSRELISKFENKGKVS
ncbi:MAG TPA: hypothetical protein DCL41_05400 [Bdellovibrionales bacterium]|nr:hypothetical protein [Pseudobdellovibrionaceae bacterium]HAG91284.1 hypothetical protein [Bdellovibrionales bacterium]|tara:strand:+ start:3124 stop:3969 length:846 start_codon:yes stop_codon:yes gene_type:complete